MTRRAVLAATGALALLAPSSASAAETLKIEPSAATRFPERTMVLSLPVKRPLTAADVSLREDGHLVPGLRLEPVSGSRRTGTVLVIDASRSMHGEAIERAMSAARAFAQRRPAGAPLGVIFFSRTPRLALAPTTDSRRIEAALAQAPPLTKGTRTRDAAAAGVKLLAKAAVPAGSIVLLSDGADAGSATTLGALADISKRTRTRIFAVGLRSSSYDGASLEQIAMAGRGEYGEAASAGDLPKVFAALSERLASEYLVRYRSRAPLGSNVLVVARVAGVPGRALTTYDTPALPPAAPTPAPHSSARLGSSVVAALAALAALLVGATAFALVRPRRRTVVDRVGDFATEDPAVTAAAMDLGLDRPARTRSRRWQQLAELLDVAGVPLTPERFGIIVAGATVGLVYLCVIAGRPILAVMAVGTPLAARAVVSMRARRRRRAFDEQLPDNLQLVASALRAGHGFSGALATAAEDASEPSRSEFLRAVSDERVGMPIDTALAHVGRRMQNPEIDYVGIVARQQREIGGNTAEVLDRVVGTIRERQRLRREVLTLTAQGRLGGGVVSGLPLVLMGAISVLHPGYMNPLLKSSGGRMVLMFAGVLMVSGWLAIRKIVDIKV